MTRTARLGLIFIGIWLVLTVVGWGLLQLYGRGMLPDKSDASFLIAMVGAAFVTTALQFAVQLVDAFRFIFSCAKGAWHWSRKPGFPRRRPIAAGVLLITVLAIVVLLARFGPPEPTAANAIKLGLALLLLMALPIVAQLPIHGGAVLWFLFGLGRVALYRVRGWVRSWS